MSTVIKVTNLSKIYRLGQIGTGTISRDLERWYKMRIRGQEDPFLKIGETNERNKKGVSDVVYALRDINFEVQQGEALGIIGKNGAGKSTLLKIISRVTSPTSGKIQIKGRVASLLEVGTGFHPELSGRENIYLNGAILGMSKREITRKLDEIIDFSGVERYIDTPVKRYSSGMYVRLAFAVAAHLESEILIVDEVLAVGDAEFQKKCLGKMGEVSKGEGRTVLFVSHNMGAVQKLCKTGILLSDGKIILSGAILKIVDEYINSKRDSAAIFKIPKNKDIDRSKGFAHTLQIEDKDNNLLSDVPVGVPWQIRVCFTLTDKVNYFIMALGFRTMLDVNIRTVFSQRMDLEAGEYEVLFKENELMFGEGRLLISVGMSSYEKAIHYVEDFAYINFTAINCKINDSRIIRTAASTILNPMEIKLFKK
jgi:ABC-type polysaccharide/polyol phosphate transport system ATPase subunit